MGIDAIWAKLLAIGGTLLAMFGLLKLSNKKAADAKEAEIKLKEAESKLANVEAAKDENEKSKNLSDDDAVKRLLD
jgi:hypothetical protein